MSPLVIICTTLLAAVGALALTRWLRQVAKSQSRWLTFHLHVPLAALAAAGAAIVADNWPELIGYTLLAVGCALLFVVDLAAMRLPNIIVGPLYLVLLAAFGAATLVTGDWLRLVVAIGCAVGCVALYLLMAVIRPGQLGMGDVKFAGVLGMFLGWLGWGELLLGLCAAFILSALVALVMMWFWKLLPKHMFPFGPFMVAGAAVGAAFGSSVLVIG